MQEPAGRTQARRSHSQHQHTRLIFSQPNPRLRHTSRHSTLRSQPPQQAKHATPHHRRDTPTARPMLRAATLTLTAALLMAAATTAARRDTTSGCEDQRYIQRTSTEQPWHTQCTPKESPEHHHEHNHRTVRSNQCARMHYKKLYKSTFLVKTHSLRTERTPSPRKASHNPHPTRRTPRMSDAEPVDTGPARAPVPSAIQSAAPSGLAGEGGHRGRPAHAAARRRQRWQPANDSKRIRMVRT